MQYWQMLFWSYNKFTCTPGWQYLFLLMFVSSSAIFVFDNSVGVAFVLLSPWWRPSLNLVWKFVPQVFQFHTFTSYTFTSIFSPPVLRRDKKLSQIELFYWFESWTIFFVLKIFAPHSYSSHTYTLISTTVMWGSQK